MLGVIYCSVNFRRSKQQLLTKKIINHGRYRLPEIKFKKNYLQSLFAKLWGLKIANLAMLWTTLCAFFKILTKILSAYYFFMATDYAPCPKINFRIFFQNLFDEYVLGVFLFGTVLKSCFEDSRHQSSFCLDLKGAALTTIFSLLWAI